MNFACNYLDMPEQDYLKQLNHAYVEQQIKDHLKNGRHG